MRSELSPFRFAVCTIFIVGLFTLQAYAQEKDYAQDADHQKDHPNGIVQDWSRRHVVYPRFGPIESLIKLQHDPRAILSWQAAEREDWHRAKDRDADKDIDEGHGHSHGKQSALHRDWSIHLGSGTTAPSMYPAKYTFDVNAMPSCSTDFIVYPVNATGNGTQPNIVAFDNLYSGTSGGIGICNRATPLGTDDGVSATLFWSYNVQGISTGGQVATSPALSLDGTKVAFVETASGHAAHFHVLAWQSIDQTAATYTQNVSSPLLTINSATPFAPLAPVAGSGTATDLTLGSDSDTLSSPFVDYDSDVAYIGNDSGTLFRVTNVFCTLATCSGAAPSLDPTWGSGGGLATGCSGVLTGPVVAGNGNIFVGCSDGKLYGFTSAGVPLVNPSVTVGGNLTAGGIVDPPLLDNVYDFVYVVSGNSSGGTSVLVQASAADLSSPVVANLGKGGQFNLHTPAFNNAYYSSSTSGNWLIYEWALSGDGSEDTIYGAGFDPSHHMTLVSGAPANSFAIPSTAPLEFSPLAEILNTTTSTDQLFVSGGSAFAKPNFVEYNLTDFSGLFPNAVFPYTPGTGATTSGPAGASTTEGSGTTGIVVDNVSSSGQASSIYFGVLGSNSAVKLTQSGLN